MKHLFLSAVGVALLSGCSAVTAPPKLAHEAKNTLLLTQAQRDYSDPTPSIYHFNAMYAPTLSKKESEYPDWYYEPPGFSVDDLELDAVLSAIARQNRLKVEYRTGVERENKVTVSSLSKTSTGELLTAVEATTGYQIDISENTLVVNKFVTEIFPIRSASGKYGYGIGKKNEQNGQSQNDSSFASSDAVRSTGDEYSKIEGEVDPLIDFKNGVEVILGCKEEQELRRQEQSFAEREAAVPVLVTRCDEGASVKELRSDNSLLVKALPSQLENVRHFVESKTERELRQVRFNLTLVAIEVSENTSLNFDANVIDAAIGGSRFGLATAAKSAGSVIGGLTTPGSVTLSHDSGTELVLQALEEQGTILAKSKLRTTAFNHRIAKLTDIEKQSFIADRELQTTAVVGTTTGIEQQVVESGLTLYVLPNIGESDVVLHVSSSVSALLGIATKGEDGNQVESPNITDREFSTAFRIYPNKPFVLGGFSIQDTQSMLSKNGLTGLSRSSSNKETELLFIAEVEYL